MGNQIFVTGQSAHTHTKDVNMHQASKSFKMKMQIREMLQKVTPEKEPKKKAALQKWWNFADQNEKSAATESDLSFVYLCVSKRRILLFFAGYKNQKTTSEFFHSTKKLIAP